jgi:hypothetical protein
MQTEWFRGAAITVRYDDQRQLVLFVANNGRVPTLELAATAFVSAQVEDGKLVLVGMFEDDTRIALKLPSDDALGIALTLGRTLALPRQARAATLAELAQLPDGTFVAVEGRCWSYFREATMEGQVALLGITRQIEFHAPYRVTGFYTHRERAEIRVFAIEHLNPPVGWFTGDTVRVMYAPEPDLLGLLPNPGHELSSPRGTLELWLPPQTLISVALDRDALVFEGDLTRTGYATCARLAPVGASDARAIVQLLTDKLHLPRTPRPITSAEVASIAHATLVVIDGTFRYGHCEGPNFDANIQLKDHDRFETGVRYRVTGFLYPGPRSTLRFPGHSGPSLKPMAFERLP